jgi:hypothetical protein
MMAAPLPPEMAGGDPNAMAAMLGGGDPAMGGMPPMDPMAGDPMAGGMPPEMAGMPPGMGADPAAGMAPAGGNPYPTADPNFMAQMLGQIIEAQQMDAQQLQGDQQAALMGNPMMQGLLAGAPMGPGAGQDGAGIAMGGELPAPPMV